MLAAKRGKKRVLPQGVTLRTPGGKTRFFSWHQKLLDAATKVF
jgi:hypothetical protein